MDLISFEAPIAQRGEVPLLVFLFRNEKVVPGKEHGGSPRTRASVKSSPRVRKEGLSCGGGWNEGPPC